MRPRKHRTPLASARRGGSPTSFVTERPDCLPSNSFLHIFEECRRRIISAFAGRDKSRNRGFFRSDSLSERDETENDARQSLLLSPVDDAGDGNLDDSFAMTPTAASASPSGWSQLKALLWKSWLTQKRRPLWTLAELLVPLVLTAALMTVHFLVKEERWPDTVYQPFYVHGDARDYVLGRVDGYPLISPSFTPTELYYAPRTPVTEVIVRKLVNKLNMVPKWAPANPCSQYLADAADELQKTNSWRVPPFQMTATGTSCTMRV